MMGSATPIVSFTHAQNAEDVIIEGSGVLSANDWEVEAVWLDAKVLL